MTRPFHWETFTERYFYTLDYPHRWSSGPNHFTLNDQHQDIASLEEAKALAEKHAVGGYNEDRCVTTYGVEYGEFQRAVWDE